jgi:perosamine synthetase
MKNLTIPFSKANILDSDLNKVKKAILSGWLTHGPNNKKFEDIFKKFTRTKFSTTVSNCTAGLHLACLALGLKKGDEVIVPAMTHTATAHAVEFTGAKVIFADVDRLNGNILVSEIKKKYTKKTRCVIVVHMAGYPCDMMEIQKFCNKKGVKIIEDCAHALGSSYRNMHVGNFGICGVFSFYPTKQITSGEGGMVISNNNNFIKKIKSLKAFGINTPPQLRKKQGLYDVECLGYNYRMTEFQAALAIGQLQRYKLNLRIRQKNALLYIKEFKKIFKVRYQTFNKSNSYFIFQLFFISKYIRDKILLKFKKKNIGASIHYATPVPFLKYYKRKYRISNKLFPNSRDYSDKVISLPVHPYLTKKMIKLISLEIKKNI